MAQTATLAARDMTASSKRARYERLWAALKGERASFDVHWRDLSEHIQPRRSRFWAGDKNKGDRRNQRIIDSTATFSARTLASGLHAGLTSPARPWMKLSTADPDLMARKGVQAWLYDVTRRMLAFFEQSNLYNALPSVYGDMGTFGTGAMAVLRDSHDLFRCYPFPVGSYAIGLDARGLATVFVREFTLTVRQVVERYLVVPGSRGTAIDWKRASTTLKRLWDAHEDQTEIPLLWVVAPNDQYRPGHALASYAKWASCTFERTEDREDTFLRESGFRTFPVLAPRWDVTDGDSYGVDCPGMTALGDVRQLQMMQRRKAQAIAKMVDPPLVGPTALRTQKTSLLPGDITFVDVRDGMQGLRSIHDVSLNIRDLALDIRETQYRIQRAFYEDLFLMLINGDPQAGQQPITAREVQERHEEKLLALGPVLERTNDELLNPLIDRVWALMMAAGEIPPPPPELHGLILSVQYTSILAQAQKLVGVTGADRFLSSMTGFVQLFPEARNKIDPYQVVDDYADMLGVDPKIIIDSDTAKQQTAAQQQAQQQAAAAEQAAQMAKAGQAAGNTPMDQDNVLTRLIANVTGVGAS